MFKKENRAALKKWLGLLVTSLALAIIIIDTTVMNVSLRDIMRDLNADLQTMQWIILGHALFHRPSETSALRTSPTTAGRSERPSVRSLRGRNVGRPRGDLLGLRAEADPCSARRHARTSGDYLRGSLPAFHGEASGVGEAASEGRGQP